MPNPAQRILLSVPHMGGSELHHVQDAFNTNWLSSVGPALSRLEDTFSSLLGRPAVAVSSGTAALHLALSLAGVRPGDDVVTQSLTFVASASPILHLGARPVLIDSEPDTWNLDPVQLASFLQARARTGRLPRAVLVVHLFGQPARIHEIAHLCRQYRIPLIEDAAESLGALYHGRHPGTLGDFGAFSFNGNKVITGTTGGLLVTRSQELATHARHLATHARDPDPEGLRNYIHSEAGFNFRMSNVVAAILLGQLDVLQLRVQQRQAVFNHYRHALASIPGLSPQPEHPDSALPSQPSKPTRHSRWLSCFLVDPLRFGRSAPDLIRWLDQHDIEARPVWRPMHRQPLFASAERIGGHVADDLHQRGLCLPSSSSLSLSQQQRVIDVLRAALRA